MKLYVCITLALVAYLVCSGCVQQQDTNQSMQMLNTPASSFTIVTTEPTPEPAFAPITGTPQVTFVVYTDTPTPTTTVPTTDDWVVGLWQMHGNYDCTAQFNHDYSGAVDCTAYGIVDKRQSFTWQNQGADSSGNVTYGITLPDGTGTIAVLDSTGYNLTSPIIPGNGYFQKRN